MPIEFCCESCGKLLRVGDESRGGPTQCPSCGAVQVVPAAPAESARAASGSPFGAAPNAAPGSLPLSFDSENPYAAPPSPILPPPGAGDEAPLGARSGPPWERDGASLGSFCKTVMLTYASPGAMFGAMRREGGFAAPWLFGVAGGLAGALVVHAYELGSQALALAAGGLPGPVPLWISALASGVTLVASPVVFTINMLALTCVFHVALLLLGVRRPFETTFRVVAYCMGNSLLLLAVPIYGPYVSLIATLLLSGFGFCRAHEIATWKAVAAVLLPCLVCTSGIFAVVFAINYARGL